MTEQFRTEKDSMGEFQVPINAKYGASTARAVDNFPISNLRFSRPFIKALGEIKKACAVVNQNNKLLDKKISTAIITYYICPQIWAWKENRIKKIKKFIKCLKYNTSLKFNAFIIFSIKTKNIS